MKQSSIEWLMEIDKSRAITIEEWQQAKEMEKEQIIAAFVVHYTGTAEQYYNETFKTN
jgi:hypothetical protein